MNGNTFCFRHLHIVLRLGIPPGFGGTAVTEFLAVSLLMANDHD